MSAAMPPPLPADDNRASSLYAAFWAPMPILAAVLAARFYVRFNMRTIGTDDWLMLFAYILFILTVIFGTLYVEAGGARHIFYIAPLSQLTKVMRYAVIAQPFGAVACTVSKTSVAGLTLRIAGPNTFWRKWILYIGISIAWALTIVDVALKFAQCKPVRAAWDVEMLPTEKQCWNPSVSADMSIANSSFGAVMDFVLALIPCTIVWNLKVAMKTKLGLMAFLSLGIVAGIGAAVKSQQLQLLKSRADFTWGVYDMYVWTIVELTLVIFCGCIPPIKPLFDWMRKGKPIAPSGASSSAASKSFKSWKLSSPSTGGYKSPKSTISDRSFTKSQQSGVQDDENELWGRTKNGILVNRQYDVDSHSVPSVHSAEDRAPVGARQDV